MSAPAATRWGAPLAGLSVAGVLVVLLAAAATVPEAWTLVVAGALLLAAGFVVMAPCQLQMAATFTVAVRNLAARQAGRDASTASWPDSPAPAGGPDASTASWPNSPAPAGGPGPGSVRRAALLFAAGYVALYVPVAVVLGGLAWLLAGYGWVLVLAAGVLSAVLGLAALGRVPRSWLSRCRGPLGLLRSGRATFSRPFAAGVAFGQYCATCCGPYVVALVVLAGATGTFGLGAALVLAYAGVMVLPFLLPALLAPRTYRAVVDRVGELGPLLARATGAGLVALGVALVPVAVLTAG
jgi:cytochrome c biogenesis protein CcdA